MDKTNANKKSGKVLVQGAIQPDAIANSIFFSGRLEAMYPGRRR